MNKIDPIYLSLPGCGCQNPVQRFSLTSSERFQIGTQTAKPKVPFSMRLTAAAIAPSFLSLTDSRPWAEGSHRCSGESKNCFARCLDASEARDVGWSCPSAWAF